MASASETESTARELVTYLNGGHDDDGRTLGQLWRDNTGDGVDADLSVLDSLTQNDAVNGLVAAGAAGLTGAQVASSVLSAIGASSSAVPVVGWCVAAAVVIANTVLAAFTNANKLSEGRSLGRKQLTATNHVINALHLDHMGYYAESADWGIAPQFHAREGEPGIRTTNAQEYAAAWWHLRTSEVASVLAGAWGEEGLHGHYRHAFLVDVLTNRDAVPEFGKVNEGFAYLQYPVEPAFTLASGGSPQTLNYGRGAYHINNDAPFVDFWRGGSSKLVRRMTANLQATVSIRAAVNSVGDPNVRKAIVAAMLIAAQGQFESKGANFLAGAPEDIHALLAYLPSPPIPSDRIGQVRIPHGRRGLISHMVHTANPWRVASGSLRVILRGDAPEGVLRYNFLTEGKTPQALFVTPSDDLERTVLVDFGKFPPGRPVVLRDWEKAIRDSRPIRTGSGIYTALPDSHPGTAWLRSTIGTATWRLDVGGRRKPGIVLSRNVINWDAGGRDRAGGGGGGRLLALGAAAAALYVASQ